MKFMMKFIRFLLFGSLFFSALTFGDPPIPIFFGAMPELRTASRAEDPHAAAIVQLFKLLAKIRRPSGEEQRVKDWIGELAAEAGATVITDTKGNMLIQVPATGRFVGKNIKPVGLQAHLDMVEAVAPGVDPKTAFDSGVDLVESVIEGEPSLHSRDFRTTIGADNGIGVATALHFMTDKTLEHPALELVFTVEEETGMDGAFGFDLPIKSGVLVNLDMDDCEKFAVQCQGGGFYTLNTPLETSPQSVAQGQKLYQLEISGLAGGHSGLQIADPLSSGGALLVKALQQIRKSFKDFEIESLEIGRPDGLSGIPMTARVQFRSATPASPVSIDAFQTTLNQKLKTGLPKGENPEKINIQLTEKTTDDSSAFLTHRQSLKVVDYLTTLLNKFQGTIKTKGGYPNKIYYSNNFGWVFLKNGSLKVTAMPRWFDEVNLQQVFIQPALRLTRTFFSNATAEEGMRIDGWKLNLSRFGWVEQIAKTVFRRKGSKELGTFEAAAFNAKDANLPILSIGADIYNEHSYFERVSIPSIGTSFMRLLRLVTSFGDAPEMTCEDALGLP